MFKSISDLTGLDILRASFTLVFVIISFLVGLRILLKYFTLKRKELITVGLSWIFLSSPWWPLAISFITILLFNYLLDPWFYVFLMNGFAAPGLFCWIYSVSELNFPQLKKKLIVIFGIICGVYEAILLVLFGLNYELIAAQGVNFDGFNYSRSIFVMIFLIFFIVTAFVSAILFCRASLQSENETVRWKGKFLLLGFITFVAAAAIDVFSFGNKILQAILRIALSIAAILYYLGFFLPSWLEKYLIK
ncbi:MAG: conserved membrane protein of unknown function [Promethearchaeota archaeon]|nr:MAG: conserved membrane protein of unknown function [Candidatus Lokiarchaeota archaeon]